MKSDHLAARIERALGRTPFESQAAQADDPAPHIPDHELLQRIGGGSYGEVWLARGVTGALRAVKIVRRRNFSSERPYEREFRGIVQFEPISRSHASVVNVLHVGRDDAVGCFFYVMELADDANAERGTRDAESSGGAGIVQHFAPASPHSYAPRTLASDLQTGRRMAVAEVLTLGVRLADALGHLHRHRLVHRDVKPSNVIFVNGLPKLADVGLIAAADEARSFVGTEGFIPPEGPGSEQADIFGLGRLLYEAVTAKDRCEFPMLPADLDRWPRHEREAMLELNEVLARACAANPKQRHANTAEVAGDLNLILAGRSVRRAYGLERRLRQATRASVAAGIVVLVALVSIWFQREQQHRSEARAAGETALRQRAEAAEHGTRQQLYAALLEQGRATVLSGEMGQRLRALEAVRRAGAISNSAALRGVAVAALALPDLRIEREWPARTNITLMTLDPTFEHLALCRGSGPVEIYSMPDDRLLATLPASVERSAYLGLWSSDGRLLAVKRDDSASRGHRADLEVWDVAAAERILLITNFTRNAFSFHPRRPRLLAGLPAPTTSSGAAVVWDLETGQEFARHRLAGEAELLKFSPDGEHFAALHTTGRGRPWSQRESSPPSDWMVTIHRADDGTELARHVFTDAGVDLDWHPAKPWIAMADSGGTVGLMDVRTGDIHLLGRHKDLAEGTVFSPDGGYLFTRGWDRELTCWDVKAMRRAFTVDLNSFRLQFRADGRQCAVIGRPEPQLQRQAFESPMVHRLMDGEVRPQAGIYSFETPLVYRQLEEDLGGRWNYAAFSADGRWLAAGGAKSLGVWDLESQSPGSLLALVPEPWQSRVSFAGNNELFADRPGTCFRWQVAPGAKGAAPNLTELELIKPAGFASLCVLSDGILWTGTRGSQRVAWDRLAGEEGRWTPTAAGLNGVSPDGRWLGVFRGDTSRIHIYRLPGIEHVATLTNEISIRRFEFSPRGDELAVACGQGVEFWSTSTWQRTRHLPDFNGILYSPDGLTFWLSRELRAAGLYDARTLEPRLPLPAGRIPVAVSPDGRKLVVSSDTRRVQVWDLAEVRRQLRDLGLDWE